MTYGHLWADACTPGSAPVSTLGIEYGKTFTFLLKKDRHKYAQNEPK